jgi:hypothetical protein
LSDRRLSDQRLRLLYPWRHSGFHVHIAPPLDPGAGISAFEGLARYLVRATVRHAQLLVDPSPSENLRFCALEQPRTRADLLSTLFLPL